jgi:hypothetical protein
VIDDQIIEIPSIQHMFYIFQELTAYGPVYRIEQYRGFVEEDVGIIGYATGNGVDIFKQVKPVVIGSDPVYIVGNGTYTIHDLSTPFTVRL